MPISACNPVRLLRRARGVRPLLAVFACSLSAWMNEPSAEAGCTRYHFIAGGAAGTPQPRSGEPRAWLAHPRLLLPAARQAAALRELGERAQPESAEQRQAPVENPLPVCRGPSCQPPDPTQAPPPAPPQPGDGDRDLVLERLSVRAESGLLRRQELSSDDAPFAHRSRVERPPRG